MAKTAAVPREPQPKAGTFLPGTSKVDYATPVPSDTVLTDFLANNAADYLAVVSGSAHPDFEKFPDHRLVAQIPVDWQLVQRVYAKDRAAAEDTYNFSESFSGESNAHQIFTRDYLVRRSEYAPRTKLTPLAGIVNAKVTAGGTGYTQETVSVTASGGTGSGAVLTAIVRNGVVIGIAVLNEGNYTVAPNLTISDSETGAGATATASVQPAAAILVKEDLLRQQDSPTDSLYVLVRRTYEVLPGPYLPFTRYDLQLGPVQGRRRAVVNTGQAAALTPISKRTYEAREGSSLVSWEIEENWSDGTGSEGNPAYPIRVDDDYDDLKGPVEITSQVVAATGTEVGSVVLDPGVSITTTTYEAINQFLLDKKVEVFLLPAPELTEPRTDPETGAATNTYRQIRSVGDSLRSEGSIYNTQIVISCKLTGKNAVYGVLITQTMALPPSRTERKSRGFQFPAQFVLLDPLWDIPHPPGYFSRGPFPGVNYTLTAHRSANRPAECLISYTNGPSIVALPDIWTVTTPGAASKVFPIGQNTIHNAIEIFEYNPAPLLIEDLPASDPASYNPTDELVIEVSERKWKGPIWEREVFTIQETP